MKKWILAVLALGLFYWAFAKDKLLFVCEEYPPYEYLHNNLPLGMDIEIINAVCNKAGIDYEIRFYPWERCLYLIKSGKADVIFGLQKNLSRQFFLKYPDYEICKDRRVIISLADSKLTIKSRNDLKGLTVGVVRGYAYHPDFDNDNSFQKDLSNTSESLIEKLNAKRYQLIAINEYVAKFLISEKNWSKYKVHPYLISDAPLYTGFAKSSTNAMTLFPRFNKALTELTKKGDLAQIRKKYR
jgi:ABC-type amino acid transport substrate-binding protein